METIEGIYKAFWRLSPRDYWMKLRSLQRGVGRSAGPRFWCLSTGRVGSQSLARLGRVAIGSSSQHEPRPLLYGLGKYAYACNENEMCAKILLAALETCRTDLLNSNEKIYLETSPQVTFLAPYIAAGINNSRFIHVIRHPADVVRSGMRRRWYSGNAFDRWRLVPMPGTLEAESWPHWCAFRKNVWLWVETNRWITEFLSTMPNSSFIVLKSEELFSANEESIGTFYKFLGCGTPPRRRIDAVIGKKLNAQRCGNFPKVEAWTSEQLEFLAHHAGSMMERFGYTVQRCGD